MHCLDTGSDGGGVAAWHGAPYPMHEASQASYIEATWQLQKAMLRMFPSSARPPIRSDLAPMHLVLLQASALYTTDRF